MQSSKYLISAETKDFFRQKIVNLRKDLAIVIDEMGDAAKHNGDLRENFAYMEKEKEVDVLKARIIETKNVLANSQIYRPKKSYNKIDLGCKFTILFLDTNEEKTYIYGGEYDAVCFNKKYLNYKSPLGISLNGKKFDDTVNDFVKVLKIF
jgi:transcription elongation GreA/GreB family factor